MTVLAPERTHSPSSNDMNPSEMVHLVCCYDNVAICGAPLQGLDVPQEEAVDCVVCAYMEEHQVPTPCCGS